MPATPKIISAAVVSLGLALYPLTVYWLAGTGQTGLLIPLLGLLLAIRLVTLDWTSSKHLVWALLGVVLFCVIALADTQLRLLKLYPVLISLAGASYCGYTLAYPPSAIERFARRVGMQPPRKRETTYAA